MADLFKLRVITPDGPFYEGEVSMVELNTSEGQIGVYQNHVPMTYMIAPGVLSIHEEEETKKAALHKGFVEIDKSMKGFICPQALRIASETRTSTPVRICRDKESLQCTGLCNLYPSGEGAGYSGGIVSSAMDGNTLNLSEPE